MTTWKLIYYHRKNLAVIFGIAVSATVITGSLIIGDSIQYNLNRIVDLRLGTINYAVTTGERFVTSKLAESIQNDFNVALAPVLVSDGIAVSGGGESRVNNVQILGVEKSFDKLFGFRSFYAALGHDEAIISKNLAGRLNLKEGDEFLLRIRKVSLIPLNAPFVVDEVPVVSSRFVIKAVADEDQMSGFNLRISQTSPFNVFISLESLNNLLELNDKSNLLVISASSLSVDSIYAAIQKNWSLDDTGLYIRELNESNEYEVLSERVFLDMPVINALKAFPVSGEFVLTYFVNDISNKSAENRNYSTFDIEESIPLNRFNALFSNINPSFSLVNTSFNGITALSSVINTASPEIKSDPVLTALPEKPDKAVMKKVSGQSTPYSFISTLPDSLIADNEIIVNSWLAEDLNIAAGDTLFIKYYTVGPLRRLTESGQEFIVKDIVPMKGRFADNTLMPDIPGLSDAGNCRDWETGIPINLNKIRDKDEKYWSDFKGRPKAFVSVTLAKKLWENMYGSYTSVRYSSAQVNKDTLADHIRSHIDPQEYGFQVSDVRNESVKAAGEGVDFTELFFALSFFVLLSGIILSILLLILNLEGRRSQLLTLSALGIPRKTINKLILSEGFILSFSGSLAGAAMAIIYTKLVISALNGVWADIVRTDMMKMYVNMSVLLSGFAISVLTSWLTLFFTIRAFLKVKKSHVTIHLKKAGIKFRKYTAFFSGSISVILIISQILRYEAVNSGIFFMAGGLMLLSLLLWFYHIMHYTENRHFTEMNLLSLSTRNSLRNKNRSISIITLLAIGTFLVLSTGANRKDLFVDAAEKSSGTGGFLFFAESVVPITRDLNDAAVKDEFALSNNFRFIQFSRAPGDEASCLNLNKISTPLLLGVDPGELEGRFSFATRTPWLDKDFPWSSLKDTLPGGLIPAIADQTVIKWSLGMKVGDTLVYTDEAGKNINLLLIGGLANSVFQGNVIIADEYFQKHFPDHIGSGVFLIDADTEEESEIKSQLELAFRDYGWEMVKSAQRLAEFNSVENTYLSIFLLMGILALFIGTVGLSVILVRSILERKHEIALFKAMGINRRKILKMFMNEYLLLLFAGILTGVLTSAIATLPSLISPHTDISVFSVLNISVLLFLNGIIWIWLMVRIYLKDKDIAVALRNE